MKRLAFTMVALVALFVSAAPAVATPVKTVESFPVEFKLTSETCPRLPHGTVLKGDGTGTSITTTNTNARGATTITNRTQSSGTATDEAGNTYRFVYINNFRVTSTDDAGHLAGPMHDLFVLSGQGPARLVNGFTAVVTFNPDDAPTYEPVSQFGDPISFPAGATICDPL